MAQEKETENKQTNGFMESMKLFQKVYDFLVYIFPILGQLPKFEKFALQLYIKQSLFELVKNIIRFRKTGTKSHIYAADVELEFIRVLIRLAYDLKYSAVNKHRYEVASRKLAEVGKILGGIIGAVKDGKWK